MNLADVILIVAGVIGTLYVLLLVQAWKRGGE